MSSLYFIRVNGEWNIWKQKLYKILNTKEYSTPTGVILDSAPCSGSSCVYLCKRKNANGVGTCIGPKKQENFCCVYKCP